MQQMLINPRTKELAMYADDGEYISIGIAPKELTSVIEALISFCEDYKSPQEQHLDLITELALEAKPEVAADAIAEWGPGEKLKAGNYRKYEGKIYKVVQGHTTQEDWKPGDVPALFTLANKSSTDPGGEILDFVQPTGAHDAYSIGDKVKFEGKISESTINANTWSPTTYPRGWKEISNG